MEDTRVRYHNKLNYKESTHKFCHIQSSFLVRSTQNRAWPS
jgi:hypothetical protein